MLNSKNKMVELPKGLHPLGIGYRSIDHMLKSQGYFSDICLTVEGDKLEDIIKELHNTQRWMESMKLLDYETVILPYQIAMAGENSLRPGTEKEHLIYLKERN